MSTETNKKVIVNARKLLSFNVDDGAITNSKLEDGSITLEKLDDDLQEDIKNIQDILDDYYPEESSVPMRLSIESSLGNILVSGETTTFNITLMKGFDNITSTVVKWEVLRDSGDSKEDNFWNGLHKHDIVSQGTYATLTIGYNDLGVGTYATFNITAELPDGQKISASLN